MTRAEPKIVQYLSEAHAIEDGLLRVLQSQIAVTPRGAYRDILERHKAETEAHVERVRTRLGELGESRNVVQLTVGLVETAVGQAVALAKTPLDLIRGSGGEEKVLKNARDTCATEALEIAVYTALERVAKDLGDQRTAELATAIRAEEQRTLDRVLAEIPALAGAVVQADVKGKPTFDPSTTGAAETGRKGASAVRRAANTATTRVKGEARGRATSGRRAARRTAGRAGAKAQAEARKVPGVARAEGEVAGATAGAADLPIPGYTARTAEEIVGRLPRLSQADLARVDGFERVHDARATVLERISALTAEPPWSGYDEQTVAAIRKQISKRPARSSAVREYERAHKDRAGVISAAENAGTKS